MTSVQSFTRTPNPNPASEARRSEILADPPFGQFFTDHMVTVAWDRERGWHDAATGPYRPLQLDPAASVLHYGQAIFEGLKAYRQPDGSVATFRPEANAARFRASARRLAMPELPDELFLGSLREIVEVDLDWIPAAGSEEALYLRPFMISTEPSLGVRAANTYLYTLIASPSGPFFRSGIKPVKVWLSTEYVRATPGGTGAAKCAGNYAASLLAQAQAVSMGCDQVVWLDAVERRWIEEMGGMNLYFVMGDHLVTPELTGALLPGITRDSLLTLARDLGYTAEERRISTDELEKKVGSGEITEVFACGTAAVITPVGSVRHAGGGYPIADGNSGEVTMRLRNALTSIQRGQAADPHSWMMSLRNP
jgi:branched-chain amino acid aminotransferase